MKWIFSLLMLAGLQPLHAQAPTLETALNQYTNEVQPEKVFLHFNQASYYPGQTIWFKAYLQQDGLPATSRTLYADWIAEDGKVLQHTVAPVVNGMTNGQFDVPEDFAGKVIQVRAYTRWMLNFDSAFLYSKDIRILSPAAAGKVARPAPAGTTLRFFPEGGDLVTGIGNKVAFKANDAWGRPVRIKGIVVNKSGQMIDSLRPLHNGMGYLMLVPAEGESYVAKWKDEKGAEQTAPLPAAQKEGVTMQVALTGAKRTVHLQATPQWATQTLTLVGTLNQHFAFQTPVQFSGGVAKKIIPVDHLPSGLLTLTLLDAASNPVAERVSFINNGEYRFTAQTDVQHWGLSKRARNELQISVPDSVESATFSIAVTDAAIDADSSDNIYSALLLTSDIRGYVHQPAHYFASLADSLQQQLDLVMLTNGWRRFTWPDVVSGKKPRLAFPKDTTYLSLSGSVFGVSNSLLTGNESIVLLVRGKDSLARTLVVPLSRSGTFADPNFVFFDTLRVFYQLKSKLFTTGEARFMTERLPAPNYVALRKSFANRSLFLDTVGTYRLHLLANEPLQRLQREKSRVLETVTVKARVKTPLQELDEKYGTGFFSGADAQQFDLLNDPRALSAFSIFSYLQGQVAGLQISTASNPPSLSWRGSTPQLYLDEMPVDASFVANLPVADVAYIKVFRPPFIGPGGGAAGGGIAIFTRRGNDVRSTPGKGLNSSMVMGYTAIREFYAPNYSRFDPRNEQTDTRTTLYWNPMVEARRGKPARVTFYNNDVSKAFRVVVVGMSKDGLLMQRQEIME